MAIDLLYVFPVLLSVLSITSPSDPTTKDTASVFNHAGPTPKTGKKMEREGEREREREEVKPNDNNTTPARGRIRELVVGWGCVEKGGGLPRTFKRKS